MKQQAYSAQAPVSSQELPLAPSPLCQSEDADFTGSGTTHEPLEKTNVTML